MMSSRGSAPASPNVSYAIDTSPLRAYRIAGLTASVHVRPQEVDGAAPRQLRGVRVVGAEPVLVVVERVARRVVEELDRDTGLPADLLLLRPGLLDRVEVVALAVVTLHRGAQAGVGVRHGRTDAVEGHRGADLLALLGGQEQHEPPAHAEADGTDRGRRHRVVAEQEVNRTTEVA